MAGFNKATSTPRSRTSIATASVSTPDATTHQGGAGYTYTPKSELFLLGVSNMVGEKTFYETADDRDARFERLVRQVAVEDGDWFTQFVGWLRDGANMRSASIVAAAEGVHARLAAEQVGGNRQIVSSALQRADEPGELLAYWEDRYGEDRGDGNGQKRLKLPMPLKRGIGDATARLYKEYSALKYDTAGKGKRFGDVLELTHANAHTDKQNELYRWLIDRRHGRADGEYPQLTMVEARRKLEAIPQEKRRGLINTEGRLAELGKEGTNGGTLIHNAGMTWESLASWLGGELDAGFWESMIPTMGYMALLRNLRNFDKAGISPSAVKDVQARLTDPEQVARSRQFPYRFWMAYQAVESLRWSQAIEEALDLSVQNIPVLDGSTVVLVDTSGSMGSQMSAKSKMSYAQAAALFGAALAVRNPGATLHGFADGVFEHKVTRGSSVLRATDAFMNRLGEVGHGTNIGGALKSTYAGQDRIILISDMQTMGNDGNFVDFDWNYYRLNTVQTPNANAVIPSDVPVYSFNLAGYATAALPSNPNRHNLGGGFTDAAFRLIPLLEAGKKGAWPWSVRD